MNTPEDYSGGKSQELTSLRLAKELASTPRGYKLSLLGTASLGLASLGLLGSLASVTASPLLQHLPADAAVTSQAVLTEYHTGPTSCAPGGRLDEEDFRVKDFANNLYNFTVEPEVLIPVVKNSRGEEVASGSKLDSMLKSTNLPAGYYEETKDTLQIALPGTVNQITIRSKVGQEFTWHYSYCVTPEVKDLLKDTHGLLSFEEDFREARDLHANAPTVLRFLASHHWETGALSVFFIFLAASLPSMAKENTPGEERFATLRTPLLPKKPQEDPHDLLKQLLDDYYATALGEGSIWSPTLSESPFLEALEKAQGLAMRVEGFAPTTARGKDLAKAVAQAEKEWTLLKASQSAAQSDTSHLLRKPLFHDETYAPRKPRPYDRLR